MDPQYAGEASDYLSMFQVLSLYQNEREDITLTAVKIALSSQVVLRKPDELFNLLSSIPPYSTFALSCGRAVIGLVSTAAGISDASILGMLALSSRSVDGVRDISSTTVAALKSNIRSNDSVVDGIVQAHLWQGLAVYYEQLVRNNA